MKSNLRCNTITRPNHHPPSSTYQLFLSFAHQEVDPRYKTQFHDRFKGTIRVFSEHGVFINGYTVSETFITHNWFFVQLGKTYPWSPFKVDATYVLDENNIAHILSYEIWLDVDKMVRSIQTHGMFEGELELICALRHVFSRQSILNHPIPEQCVTLSSPPPSSSLFTGWNNQYPLMPHQLNSYNWMLNTERNIVQNRASVRMTPYDLPILQSNYYFNCIYNIITNHPPQDVLGVNIQGGCLADVTGSGKTAAVLRLIMATRKNNAHHMYGTGIWKHMYIKSQATMVIVPSNLAQQWVHEIQKFILKTPPWRIVTIINMSQMKKVKYEDLVQADIVITTFNFISSSRYRQTVQHIVRAIVQQDYKINIQHQQTLDHDWSYHALAWKSIRNRLSRGRPPTTPENDLIIPLESIYWRRVVVDEIHVGFSRTKWYNVIQNMEGGFKWGLTGTPMIQNTCLLERYIQYFTRPSFSTCPPGFTTQFVDSCFHRFSRVHFGPIQHHVIWVELSPYEHQMLHCYQNEMSTEETIRMCSYFNVPKHIRHMDRKIKIRSIKNIITQTKRTKRAKIRDLDRKINHLNRIIGELKERIETTPETERKRQGWVRRLKRSIQRCTMYEKTRTQLHKSISFFESQIHSYITNAHPSASASVQITHDSDEKKDASTGGMCCPICFGTENRLITPCGHMFCRPCILRCLNETRACPVCKVHIRPKHIHEIAQDPSNQIDHHQQYYGSKITRMIQLLRHIVTSLHERVVVCVQWSSLMKSVHDILVKQKFRVGMIWGNTCRQNATVRRFKQGELDITLISAENTITGLDLVESNHIIFCHALLGEEYEVKAIEEQFIARVHRTGQNKEVHVYWMITRNTIEEQTFNKKTDGS